MGNTAGDSLKIRLNLSTTLFRPLRIRMQTYSPGISLCFRRHTIYSSWDLYDDYYFEFEIVKRAPQGFQVGYRYAIVELFSRLTFSGELNYRHFSFLNPAFDHIKYAQTSVFGVASYADMGYLMVGFEYPVFPFLLLTLNGGYGLAHFDRYFIATNRWTTAWEKYISFGLGIGFMVGKIPVGRK
ncbi:MAG: hypothetical protein SF052_25325 [Bacteroidia bacterium]|nr:hypothetical protein [Bacteroidia bacterium]